MDLAERIQRRRTGRTDDRLVIDWEALNPASHLCEPVGRAALIEAILDSMDPIFDDQVPPSLYVWGPKGSGKSALVTAIMGALDMELSSRRTTYTATRGRTTMSGLRYVYVDTRRATSEFKLYQRLLDGLTEETIPTRGIGTDDLVRAIREELTRSAGVVLAVDHVGSPLGADLRIVENAMDRFDEVGLVVVGRDDPADLTLPVPSQQVHVPGYSYELIDVLTVRASRGLSRPLEHSHARAIADWAEGNAHDAMGALFLAASFAEDDGAGQISSDHVQLAIEEIPPGGAPLSQLLALTSTEQAVVEELLAVDDASQLEIDEMATRIGDSSHLSSATVKRILYELAQADVLDRIQIAVGTEAVGRRPSMVRPNFPVRAFERL